ncbi:MAG: DUF3347 domain-containing protein [Saprospiraceae bacterium]|nr:DUF3347 domain-containing protein [Saprospiraceae bacterium]HMS97160.1 DUF3347 domain-containing protein [Saprospiraceae bacterium]
MKSISTFLAMTVLTFFAMAQHKPQDLLLSYLKVKDALVADDGKLAKTKATEFFYMVDKESDFEQKEAVTKALRRICDTDNIEIQRIAFAGLSTEMWAMLDKGEKVKLDLYYQYCPMKRAYWISLESAIKNPYYGASMLTCGKVSDKKLN